MAYYQVNRHGRFIVPMQCPTVATSDATTTVVLFHNTTGRALTLQAAYLTSATAYTGADTNYRSVEITDGTEMASWDGDNNNDLAANTPQALTLSGTAANLVVAAGNTVRATFTENGTGLGLTLPHLQLEFE